MGKRIVYRDKLGRFSKKENIYTYQEVENNIWKKPKRYIKEKTYFKYTYIISFDYNKKGRHGKHDFHSEYELISPRELSIDEIREIILSTDYDLEQPNSYSKMRIIKGMEIEEVDYEVKLETKCLSHKY